MFRTVADRLRTILLKALTGRRPLRRVAKRHRIRLELLEDRLVPATVQFNAGSESINESAGTFSIPVTLSGAASQLTVSTFADGFNEPEGMAIDSSGNIYVANYNNDSISKITPAGVVSGFAAIGFPEGMAINAAGDLFVASTGNNGIEEITPSGVVSTFLTNLNPQGPVWLAFDPSGNLYFTNSARSGEEVEVSKATPEGVVSTYVNNGNYANGLAFDLAGNLYISNFDNSGNDDDTVEKVTPGGDSNTFATGFTDPAGLAFDSNGNLYVANSYPSNSSVSEVTPSGDVSTYASGFSQPTGLVFDSSGNLDVGNFLNGTVSKVGNGVSVPFTLGGSATAGIDYTNLTPSPLFIPAGQTSATITGTLWFDPGSNQTLMITLGSPTGANLGSPSLNTLTIDEPAAPTVQFTAGSESVDASAGTFSIPVTLSDPPLPAVSTFASGLDDPWGIAADSAGNIYVANYGNSTINKITPSGSVSTFADVSYPEGLAINAAGDLFVASTGSTGSNSIDEITPSGVVSTFLNSLNPQGPVWVAIDPEGNIYFTNSAMSGENVEVSKATPAGVVSTFVNNGNYANGLTFDSEGNLYVSNFENSGSLDDSVDKATPSGIITPYASVATGFSEPEGLAFDSAGDLYVASTYPTVDTVSEVTPAGIISTYASGFDEPKGLVFVNGNLYVDNYISGTVSEINGSVSVPFTLGGSAVAGIDYSGVTASPLDFTTGQTTATITGNLFADPGQNQTLTFTLGTPTGASLGNPAVNTMTIDEPGPQNITAVDDTFSTTPNTPTTLNVLANDINPQGTGLQVISSTPITPSGPTLTQNTDGTFTFTSPDSGSYTFDYTASGAQQEVTADDGNANDYFGESVAISGDIAVIGASRHEVGNNIDQGAVYVFKLVDSTWNLQQELTASNGAAYDQFGYSVAISGNTIVVGATQFVVGTSGTGVAYVFECDGTSWIQAQELTASDGAEADIFGNSVAVFGDTIVVGSPEHKVGDNARQGAAYVYTLCNGSWNQQQELTSFDGGAGDQFGYSVAVSGATIVVGDFAHTVGDNVGQGAAYVYSYSDSTWNFQQELTASDGAPHDEFGTSVAIYVNTIVVGAFNHAVNGKAGQGAVYVYSFSGSTWSQQQELIAADGGRDDNFGQDVSIDGGTLIVGASGNGAAYVYSLADSTWTLQQELFAPSGASDFGVDVAISSETAVVGAYGQTINGNSEQGAAYIQDISTSTALATVNVTAPAAITSTSGSGQSTTVNTGFGDQLVATVTDAYGDLIPGITVTFASQDGSGATFPNGDTAVTNSEGQASIAIAANTSAGSYTVTASVSGISTPATFDLTNEAAAANHLAFTVQPSDTTAGSTIAPAVQAEVLDQYGNPLTNDNSDQVTLSVASGPGNFTSGNSVTETVNGGLATFNNLVLDTAGDYTLGETATGGLSGDNSDSFTASPAGADHLEFLVQPSNATAGNAISPTVKVAVVDEYGNVIEDNNSDQVTLTVSSGPGSFTSGNSVTESVSVGMATFNDLVLDTAGTYTLSESATNGLSGENSNSFTVSPARANHLAYSVQPSNATAGNAISPAVQVEVLDQYGNLLTNDNSDQVTLTVASGPGNFTSGNSVMETVSGGLATFNNLVLDAAGNYTLGESATGGLSGVNSDGFTVSPTAANHLTFSVQPSNTTAGNSINPAVQVEVVDQYGNLLTSDNSDQVTLTVATGPGSFASGNSVTQTVSDGIATFNSLVLDTAGSYTFGESGTSGLSGLDSSSFTVSAAGANQLAFLAQPGNTTAGVAIDPAVQVEVLDKYNNLLVSDNSDRIELSVASGTASFASASTTTATVNDGVATFNNLVLDSAGSYMLGESSTSGLTGANSNIFSVSASSADHLAFLTEPVDTTVGTAISPAVQVEILDKYGNALIDDNSGQIAMSVATGPGGFTNGSSTEATVSAGVAAFANLALAKSGVYTIAASDGALSATSNSFYIAPAQATKLVVTTQPPGTTSAGNTFSVTVEAEDAFGDLDPDYYSNVQISLAADPGGGVLGGTLTQSANAGVVSFTGLSLDTAATGYQLQITDGHLPIVFTNEIAVTPGSVYPANSLISLAASAIQLGGTTTVTLQAGDPYGNNELTGGLKVVFSLENKTGARGTFSAVKDNHNGKYTATFASNLDGSNFIAATVDGLPVADTAPISVTGGRFSTSESTIAVSKTTITAGTTATVTLQVEYPPKQDETAGGLTVIFKLGNSIGGHGTFSAVTDNGNGTYKAIFTGTLAGKNSIRAFIDGEEVTSVPQTIDVVPGSYSLAKSVVSVSSASVAAGHPFTATLQLEDAGGNKLSTSGLTVVFTLGGQQVTATQNAKTGTYSASIGETATGSYTIGVTIDGLAVTSKAPAVTVTPATLSLSNSSVTVTSPGTVAPGNSLTIYLQIEDIYGNDVTANLLPDGIAFELGSKSGGQGTFGRVSYLGNGRYQVMFTAIDVAGTNTILALIGGKRLTSQAATIDVT
jgi:sugar lactone lactonase YvrE